MPGTYAAGRTGKNTLLENFYAPRSIRTKLVLIVFAAVAVAMVLAASLSGWRAADRRFQGIQQEIHSVAATLAIAVAPAQSRGEYAEVQKILRAIGRMPRIRYARVIGENRLIAAFGNGVILARDQSLLESASRPGLLTLLTMRTFPLSVPVVLAGREIGEVQVVADVSELRTVLMDSVGSALAAGFLAVLVGLLVALRLEKTLTGPIVALTTAMRTVRERHDYQTRVPRISNDETGHLVDAFNDMLGEIRTRDAALARHRDTLEETVEQRTEELRHATVVAERANAAKSDFLATMSHEIRTPMNGMLVMAEMLNASGLPPRLQRYADVIVTSGRSLLSIINDILDFSKIEAGRMELESIPVDPRRLVDDVTRLFAERAASKVLDLAGFVAADVPKSIAADPVRLNQVLSNLVNNALKFTESGGVTVRLVTEPEARTGASGAGAANEQQGERSALLRFEVVDTGIGIPEDKLDAIFDAFSQADQSTTRKFGGTGIGLAICRRLSEAMGGEIGATSTFGQGTTFTVSAPFAVLEEADSAADASQPDRALQFGKAGSGAGEAANEIVLALRPGPTRAALSAYVSAAGFRPIIAEAAEDFPHATPAAVLAWRGASDDTLRPYRQKGSSTACVVIENFGQSDTRSPCGVPPDATLSWPISASEVEALLVALKAGDLSSLAGETSSARNSTAFARFPGVRVLAADDSAINREVLAEALGRLDIEVVSVCDGLEAVNAVTEDAYDLVFMDGSMPHLDGFEATRRIREAEAAEGRAALPIIALTAHVVGRQAELWRDAGMNDCVTKPFTIDSLQACLRRWLPDRVVDPGEGAKAESGPPQLVDDMVAKREPEGPRDEAKAAQQAEAPELIDASVLDEIRAMQSGDMDLAARVIALYRTHGPEALASLETTLRTGDDLEVAKAAHALKSLSRNIGAVGVADYCEEIEGAAREERLDREAAPLGKLAEALAATLAALPGTEEAAGPRMARQA